MKLDTKKMVTTGVLTAMGVVLPLTLHAIPDAGSIFLPMHIPVLLCGLLCGWPYGLLCGILAPLASHLLTGMPPAAILPGMLCELAVYGMAAGLLMSLTRRLNRVAGLYISLLGAMLAGRFVAGALNALIFRAGSYSMEVWLAASFAKALPGILVQLVLIPAVVAMLWRARLADRQA